VAIAYEALTGLFAETRNDSVASFVRTINPVTPSCGLTQLLAILAMGAMAAVILQVANVVCKAA
jgi:hypothetical protein